MRCRLALLLGFCFGTSACSGDRPTGPEASPAAAVSGAASASPGAAEDEWRRAAFELARAEHRWTQPWPRPDRWVERSCRGRRSEPVVDGDGELATRVEDDRWEKHDLIPYSLTLGLSTQELTDARSVLERHRLSGATVGEIRAARQALEFLSHRRYVAVFHLIQYEPAKVVHRLDKARPEWVAGLVNAWLVIHDAEELEAICQVNVIARNSVRDAPLSRRLRPAVLSRLEAELIEETWRQAEARLKLVSAGLRLPPRREETASRRLAPAPRSLTPSQRLAQSLR